MARPLIIPFFIPHAGCPHACLFCNQRLVSGTSQPLPDIAQIASTIKEWVQRSPDRPTEVAFYGGSFTLLPLTLQEQLLEAVQPFYALKQVQGIRISTRPDALDNTVLRFLSAHQVTTVEIGVQSLDEQVLQDSGRGHSVSDSLLAIQRVRDAGFATGVQLLPGLPGDTEKKALDSLHGVLAAGAQFLRMYPAVVLQGTVLAELYQAGLYQPPDLDEGIRITARLLDAAVKAGIPVIRIGLQAEEGLTAEGAILAGCWHPALGQMVKSRIFHDLVCKLALGIPASTEIALYCHPSRISEVQGQKCSNVKGWQQSGLKIATVLPDRMLENEQIRLEYLQYNITGSIITTSFYEEKLNA